MKNAVITVICIMALIAAAIFLFPGDNINKENSTETEPPQTTKVHLEGKRIECKLKDYTNDGKIGVTVHTVSTEANSTIVNAFFRNISDETQPLNLNNVFIEDRGGNILSFKKYEIIWRTTENMAEDLSSLDPEEGVRVNYYFEKTEKLLEYFAFRNVYYEKSEYTVWRIKITY
ncbi:MAG: hypothetical protein U9N35_05610 [Euryarchaeota archaeon]|nr:hypothetical protein [Euryarchaeota archaeon]